MLSKNMYGLEGGGHYGLYLLWSEVGLNGSYFSMRFENYSLKKKKKFGMIKHDSSDHIP